MSLPCPHAPPTPLRIFTFSPRFFFCLFPSGGSPDEIKARYYISSSGWSPSEIFPGKHSMTLTSRRPTITAKRLPFAHAGSWCNAEHGGVPDGVAVWEVPVSILSYCQYGHHARKGRRGGWARGLGLAPRLVWERMSTSWWWGACFFPSQDWVDLPSLVGNLSLC